MRTWSKCERGALRKRGLLSMCLSVVALGLVSVAGCQVQEHSDLNTTAETIQVPSLPELLSRASVAVSVPADTFTNVNLRIS
jgi:hypothetical protein